MEAQSLESEKQEKPNLQGLFKQVVQQKKAFNKQPVVDEGGTSSWDPIRGRPSAMDRGRKVLSVMENFATGTSPNPGREANP